MGDGGCTTVDPNTQRDPSTGYCYFVPGDGSHLCAVPDPAHVRWQCFFSPAFAPKQTISVRNKLRRLKEKLLYACFAIGQAVSKKSEVAGQGMVRWNGIVAFDVEAVVDAVISLCA